MAEEENIDNVSFLDGLISQETRRRTREQTQPFIDACCTPGCIRSTVLTVGIASLLLSALLIIIFLTTSKSIEPPPLNPKDPPVWMFNHVTQDLLRDHFQFLSSDVLEGRAPGTKGEAATTGYIVSHFRASGLHPMFKDKDGNKTTTSFIHNVPMRGITASTTSELLISNASSTANFIFGSDFTTDSDLSLSNGTITDTRMVFGGHCVYSPHFNVNPFYAEDSGQQVGVAGTIVVCLMGNLNVAFGTNFSEVSEYYTSTNYKLSWLRNMQAKGVLMIHSDNTTGYSWDVFQNRFGMGEQLGLKNSTEHPLHYKGWIRKEVAEKIARMNNSTLQAWIDAANSFDFRATPLDTRFALNATYAVREFDAEIVMGYVGPPPSRYNSVVFMAHHDFLGIRGNPVFCNNNGSDTTDNIFNGAVDNASGVAGLLTAAHALSSLYKQPFIVHPGYDPPPLHKTIIFMTTTARENMLGATYFTQNNLCGMPLCGAQIVFNFDVMNVWGETLDMSIVGRHMSATVDEIATAAISAEHLESKESSGQWLGDVWPFIIDNCSAVTFAATSTSQPNPIIEYMATKQYTPCDKYSRSFEMEGLAQQVRVALRMAYAIAVENLSTSLSPSFDSLLTEIRNVHDITH